MDMTPVVSLVSLFLSRLDSLFTSDFPTGSRTEPDLMKPILTWLPYCVVCCGSVRLSYRPKLPIANGFKL